MAPPLPDWAVDPEAAVDHDPVDHAPIRWIGVENHANCTPACRDVAVPSPYERERPPLVSCTWCGAAPGVACEIRTTRRRPRGLVRFGRSHPSRLEEGAAA